MNRLLNASLEAIDFQRDSRLLKEMAILIDGAMQKPTMENIKAIAAPLESIANKYTKIKYRINFIRAGGPDAFVIPPQADIANPMRPNELATKIKRLGRPASEQEIFKGTVDLKTGKVSGIYCEIPIDIFIAIEFITGSLGPTFRGEHLAAIICHEMGHGLTYLRYLGQTVISNCVVSEIIRRQQEGADDKAMAEVIKVAEQKSGYRLRDLGAIDKGTDPLVIQQVVMAGMVESIRSELGTKFYDRRAFEFSSDQFVARHGGAHLIVEGLDAMYRAFPMWTKEYRGSAANCMASIFGYFKLLGSALLLGAGATLVVMGAPVSMSVIGGVLLGALGVLVNLFGDVDSGIYDPIEHRYKAMRRELISSSKDQNLTVAQRKQIISQIESIDEIVSTLSDKSFFGPEVIGQWIIGVFTGRPAEQKFQRMLEEMANNRLFEMSNKLQTKMV